MRTKIFLSLLLLLSLSGCGKETVGYFTCVYGSLPERFSLVIDTQKKTMLFDKYKERTYEESGTNFLVSRAKTPEDTLLLDFDRITGKMRMVREWTNSTGNLDNTILRYQCEKTQNLI